MNHTYLSVYLYGTLTLSILTICIRMCMKMYVPVGVPATRQWGEDSLQGPEDPGWLGARNRGIVGTAATQMRPDLHSQTMGRYYKISLNFHAGTTKRKSVCMMKIA